MTIQQGQVCNPKGTNQYTGIQNVFKNLCKRDVYKLYGLLMDIVENQDTNVNARVNGIKFMLESGFGKAAQSIEVSTSQGKTPDQLTTQQLKLAAEGETEALVLDLIMSGKLAEIQERFREEPDTEVRAIKVVEELPKD